MSLVASLFRDLRGFLLGTAGKNFELFKTWFNEPKMNVTINLITRFGSHHSVVMSILKFVTELTNNVSSRLTPDHSDITGILLFRDISRVLTEYG